MKTRSSTLQELENLKQENETLRKEKNNIEKGFVVLRREKKELEDKSMLIKKLRDIEREVIFLDRLMCAYAGELQRLQSEIENCNICKRYITPM